MSKKIRRIGEYVLDIKLTDKQLEAMRGHRMIIKFDDFDCVAYTNPYNRIEVSLRYNHDSVMEKCEKIVREKLENKKI